MSMLPLTVTDEDGNHARHAIGVHIVLVRADGRILLNLRAKSKVLSASCWSVPGGNLEAGESALDATVREAREELGILIDRDDLRFATVRHFLSEEHGGALAVFFTATRWTGEPRNMEQDKCDRVDWFPPDDLPEPTVPYVAHALPDIEAGLHNGGLGCGFDTLGWHAPPPTPPGARLPLKVFRNRHPRVVASAAMLITDQAGRVGLVAQSYRQDGLRCWPGGGADDGETPSNAARREVLEELGLDIEPGALLVVDVVPADDRPPMYVFLFDGGTLDDEQASAITLEDAEITDFGFFTVDEAAALLPAHGQRRLAAALIAKASGRVMDLYDGWPRQAAQ